MSIDIKVTGRIVAAGRALAGSGPEEFAHAAGLPVQKLAQLEAGGSARLSSEADVEAILRAFEHIGVVIVAENRNLGAGVS